MTIPGKAGRKRTDQKDDWPRKVKEAHRLAKLGLLDKHIFGALDIPQAQYYKYLNENAEFKEAISKGRSLGVAKVAQELVEQSDTMARQFYLKVHGDWMEREKRETLELKRQDLELKALIASKLSPEDAEEILTKLYGKKALTDGK